MSGGHFDYKQYHIRDIVDSIENILYLNETKGDGDDYYVPLRPAELRRLKEGIKALKIAEVYAQHIDLLVSGDIGEETFHIRLQDELEKIQKE